jgi:hypothetical protein
MVFDEKTELEYMMLRNYQENGLVGRRVLIQIPFVALEKIEEDKWYTKVDENEKPKVRGIIQIDIISKIRMYMEDLAILSESFISQRNFYDLLDSVNIGDMVGNFFRKRLPTISDEEICKIMSYGSSDQFNLYDMKIKLSKL